MSEAKLGTGFRFGKIVAWTPAIVLGLAVVVMAMGELIVGGAIAAFALVVWLLASRRRKQVENAPAPPAERPAPSAGAGTPDA